ncbi:MAG: hypothetical protein H0U64_10620, partial [Gemmatimonadaceae bacterium]|nr:hypothetical protein [Gemmatimonadaceae bacterium]
MKSADSASVREQSAHAITFVCGVDAKAIQGPTVIVDLRLRSGERNRVPNDADISRIQAANGMVMHRFHVALVRVRLDTGALRALVSPTGVADYATLVDDTARMDVSAQLFYRRAITPADIGALRKRNIKTSGIPARPNIL